MSQLHLDIEHYIGGDLVRSVIDSNRRQFGDEHNDFQVIDLCAHVLPRVDLLLCRDALVHFSYSDIWRAIENITRADIRYLATTTFPGTKANTDLVTGIQWRHLNLQAAPFFFPPPLLSLVDNFNRADQVLSIWRVSDLKKVGAERRGTSD